MKRPTREQLDAWRRRSKPLAVDPGRYDTGRRQSGTTLRPRSPKLAGYYRDVRAPLVADLVERVGACQAPFLFALAAEDDPLPRCSGPLDVHERRRRSQNGSLENEDNLVVVCRSHHDRCTDAARGDVEHRARLVVFEGDAGWDALAARRGERAQR